MHSESDGANPETPGTAGGGRARLRLGLRAKVALVLLSTLLVTLTVNSLLTLRAQERDILAETGRRGHEIAHFVARHLANDVVGYNYHAIELTLHALADSGDIVHAQVDSDRGTTMAAVGSAPVEPMHAQRYEAPITLDGVTLGRLVVHLSTERLAARLKERQRDTLLRQLAAIAAVLLVEFAVLSLVIVRPLMQVSRVIGGNLAAAASRLQPIPLAGNDEIGAVARGFNALQERLAEAQRRLEGRVEAADRDLAAANRQLAAQAEELRAMNRGLEQLSVTDPLTGLYNRRYFMRLMESEIDAAIRHDDTLSILLLDIDAMRTINDRLGHRAGDDLIREVAQRIGSQLRTTDVACRYGGDEFFILCRHATIATALSIADDLQRAIAADPVEVHGETLPVRVTIGAATIPGVHRVQDPVGLFRCADEALRHAKQRDSGIAHYAMFERRTRVAAR